MPHNTILSPRDEPAAAGGLLTHGLPVGHIGMAARAAGRAAARAAAAVPGPLAVALTGAAVARVLVTATDWTLVDTSVWSSCS